MKVAVYYNNKDVRIEERPVPEINDDEILIKTMASGICGTDVLEWYRIKKAPIVLGHEIAGIVDKAGKNVKNFRIGDRVTATHHVPCMKCHCCLNNHHTACETLHRTNFEPGGFSEYIRIPKINVELGTFKLPDNVSFDEGTFTEPLGTVVRAQRLANLKEKDTLLIIGAGISGLMHIKSAKSKETKKIIAADISEYRLDAAKRFGADYVINAKEEVIDKIKSINENRLADIVIVCTGAMAAAQQGLKCVDKGGTIMFFAVPNPNETFEIPINDFWRNEVKIMTSYGAAPNDLKESLELMASGKINMKDMITHKLKFDEIQKGFNLVAEAKDSIKVIVEANR
ncbi:alcohol dehydrogenase catalytic domain-containing protein [Candidatus Woesearchaeota archaeon]|nr:alcohol dehydrogenase catalytic domain-containing protein [Candidatus Woesearchaeota archaeon]